MDLNDTYFWLQDGQLQQRSTLPREGRALLSVLATLLPPQISDLHRELRGWHDINVSVGTIVAQRFWLMPDNRLLISFPNGKRPAAATMISKGQELAGWLLLLDKWMETFVVIARARTIWSVAELGAALPFLSPCYLPVDLRNLPPDNWFGFASALSVALADGELTGEPTNRHWKTR